MVISQQLETSNNIKQIIKRLDGVNPLINKDTSFAIIAVRCNSSDSVGKRKLVAGKIYYLLNGYSVDENLCITEKRQNLNNLYDDYMITDVSEQPHVQISAIVGQNGTGKSSLIEFIMRLINNFAAITFGEYKFLNSAEHLHFINGVQGDLWYVADNYFYQLHIDNSNVALFLLGSKADASNPSTLLNIGDSNISGYSNVLPKMDDNELRRLFNHFFYTIISNHSLYAYNSNDFQKECNTDEKERIISTCYHNEKFTSEERCWLHGLFHKNDGYQTPMVITPFRSEGNININRENELVRERLISLLIRHNEFREINEHLTAYSLSCEAIADKDYGINKIRKDLGMTQLTSEGYHSIYSLIIKLWGDAIGENLTNFSNKPFYDLAMKYLVFKTLKIAYKYRQHNENFKLLSSTENVFNHELIEEMVALQIKDLSHITRKIHQTLAYIIYNIYSCKIKTEKKPTEFDFDQINKEWITEVLPLIKQEPNILRSRIRTEVVRQALLPPPFLKSQLNIRKSNNKNIKIDFESLSSGEKQLIYSVSSLLYHIDNLNSVKEDNSNTYRIPYRNVLLILEEIELYFHPELQQKFIKNLLDRIKLIKFDNIAGIHIILVTHSPYVLSDIPKENVLALTKTGMPINKNIKTFCGNIHEMLKDSFFLSNGSQGDFAQWEIGHLMACINIHRLFKTTCEKDFETFIYKISKDRIYDFTHRYISYNNKQKPQFFYKDFCLDFSEDKLRQRIAIIDEPLVRKILLKELNEVFVKTDEEQRLAKINELEEELRRLKEI